MTPLLPFPLRIAMPLLRQRRCAAVVPMPSPSLSRACLLRKLQSALPRLHPPTVQTALAPISQPSAARSWLLAAAPAAAASAAPTALASFQQTARQRRQHPRPMILTCGRSSMRCGGLSTLPCEPTAQLALRHGCGLAKREHACSLHSSQTPVHSALMQHSPRWRCTENSCPSLLACAVRAGRCRTAPLQLQRPMRARLLVAVGAVQRCCCPSLHRRCLQQHRFIVLRCAPWHHHPPLLLVLLLLHLAHQHRCRRRAASATVPSQLPLLHAWDTRGWDGVVWVGTRRLCASLRPLSLDRRQHHPICPQQAQCPAAAPSSWPLQALQLSLCRTSARTAAAAMRTLQALQRPCLRSCRSWLQLAS